MTRRWKVPVLALTGTLLCAGGAALGSDGNYCPPVDTSSCITLDLFVLDSCCKNLDGTGTYAWSCNREVFLCLFGEDLLDGLGQSFNCSDRGGACQ